jgi:xylan 1,4-beta-xylosidase
MEIQLDRNTPTKPTDRSWQLCIGNDHAFQMHRTDFCEHLKLAHDELGFRYVRFHGLFDDDMLTIQSLADFIALPGSHKIREQNFRQVGHVLDNVLQCGMKPFVELSFMPRHLASGKKTGLHYKNNITPPRDYQAWGAYIEDFIRFILNRYGKEEVESWYFEVWNEPDIPNF